MRWPICLVVSVLGTACPGPKPADTSPGETVPVARQTTAHELDRTIWDCEFSLAVFRNDHFLRVHRDVAMAVMGSNAIYTREDYDLRWTGAGTFEAALRHVEYPNGQAADQSLDGPFESYRYRLDGAELTITAAGWDKPLVCRQAEYDDGLDRWLADRYR